ncbi:MAG: riboflavin synthase [Candidatus Diapherotrites archaeon]|nr:riboflavin synthase [Candidatus Diapherotrites archaeon]
MKIGLIDTMFARINMGKIAEETIKEIAPEIELEKITVPGIKDLAVQVRILLEDKNCDIVLALGMPGKEAIDSQCAHEASLGIIYAQVLAKKPALGIFVFENEAKNDEGLKQIVFNRVKKHSINAVWMIKNPEELSKRAGTGERQGFENVGGID